MDGASICGNICNTGSESIFRERHTDAASARAKTAFGKLRQVVSLQCLEFLTDTFNETASAPICMPAASRATRSWVPADGPGAGADDVAAGAWVCRTSLIEGAPVIQGHFR